MDKIVLFHNIVQMAAVDGRFAEEEIRHLVRKADEWGIPNEEFETAMAGISTGKSLLEIPESHRDRIELMREIILMMAVDGELAEEEKQLCARVSASMGFTTEKFQEIIEALLEERLGESAD